MLSSGQGSVRLFKLFGITVYLHWMWFVVALFELQYRKDHYSSFTWNLIEYLSLFVIVLFHEFGHSLACKQVGGLANSIVLWPLGGIAFVHPPHRPGAILWSIAAGPLVNVVIGLLLLPLWVYSQYVGWADSQPDVYRYIQTIFYINGLLFVFNMLPVYPLDGGQILRSLLWFACGAGRSLQITVFIGFFGVAGLIYYAIQEQSIWLGILCFFAGSRCIAGWQQSKALLKLEAAGRWEGVRCPACHEAPYRLFRSQCQYCAKPMDPFSDDGHCQHCTHPNDFAHCLFCLKPAPISDWFEHPAQQRTSEGETTSSPY